MAVTWPLCALLAVCAVCATIFVLCIKNMQDHRYDHRYWETINNSLRQAIADGIEQSRREVKK